MHSNSLASLSRTGLSGWAIIPLVVWLGVVATVNQLLLMQLDAAISSAAIRFPDSVALQERKDNLQRVFVERLAWADASLVRKGDNWLQKGDVVMEHDSPSVARILHALSALPASKLPRGEASERLVREAFSPCTNLGVLVDVQPLTVELVVARLAALPGMSGVGPGLGTPSAKRDFVLKMVKDLVSDVSLQTRWIVRLNSPIHVLIYIVFGLCVGILWRRLRGVRTAVELARNFCCANAKKIPAGLGAAEWFQSMSRESYYRTLGTLLGFLPSLGFIGTVYGMGGALAFASDLQDEARRSSAVGEMSSQLGLAFDTTLVALVLLALAEVLAMTLRMRESKLVVQELGAIEPRG